MTLQMEDKISVSVIVPAYNAEKVISDCLDSILEQSLKNIEVIVVNDGSTDRTGEILKEYQKKDERIRLIEKKENEGLSAGRNSAVRVARGEYVGFVDADDWVERDYFRSMYEGGSGSDLIVAGYRHDTMDEARTEVYITRDVCMEKRVSDEKEQILLLAAEIDVAKMFAYTWNKLYKRDIIEENSFRFSSQVLIEDFIFNTIYWDKVESLCVSDEKGYHYVKASKEALTQKFLPDFAEIMDKRFDYMKKLMVQNKAYDFPVTAQLANIYIKHAIAGVVRNCAPEGNYSFSEQHKRVKALLENKRSKEACKNARGVSVQERVCNFVFKSRIAVGILIFGKLIYAMQTKSKTAFDKLK